MLTSHFRSPYQNILKQALLLLVTGWFVYVCCLPLPIAPATVTQQVADDPEPVKQSPECTSADEAPAGETETESTVEDNLTDWLHTDHYLPTFAVFYTGIASHLWQEFPPNTSFLSQSTPPPERGC